MKSSANRTTLLAAFALTCLDVSLFTALSPLLPKFGRELHVGSGALGVLTAAYAMGAFLFALPAGFVTDRFPSRRVVLAGVGLIATASIAFGLAHSYPLL